MSTSTRLTDENWRRNLGQVCTLLTWLLTDDYERKKRQAADKRWREAGCAGR